jgi:hypothetical protein
MPDQNTSPKQKTERKKPNSLIYVVGSPSPKWAKGDLNKHLSIYLSDSCLKNQYFDDFEICRHFEALILIKKCSKK